MGTESKVTVSAPQPDLTLLDRSQLLFVCCMTSAMLPVLLLWILFSTPRIRRQPVFWIQLVAILMSLAHGAIMMAYNYLNGELRGIDSQRTTKLKCGIHFLKWFTPLVTDTALIFRLLVFYPRQLHSIKKRAAIIALPVTAKVIRVIANSIVIFVDIFLYPTHVNGSKAIHRLTMVECGLQVVENIYISVVILRQVYLKFISKKGMTAKSRSVFTRRASRLLVEAFVLSFAPAVFIQMALLASVAVFWASGNKETVEIHYLLLFLITGNLYVSLIFSLLATSWTTLSNSFAAHCIEAEVRRRALLRLAQSRSCSVKEDDIVPDPELELISAEIVDATAQTARVKWSKLLHHQGKDPTEPFLKTKRTTPRHITEPRSEE